MKNDLDLAYKISEEIWEKPEYSSREKWVIGFSLIWGQNELIQKIIKNKKEILWFLSYIDSKLNETLSSDFSSYLDSLEIQNITKQQREWNVLAIWSTIRRAIDAYEMNTYNLNKKTFHAPSYNFLEDKYNAISDEIGVIKKDIVEKLHCQLISPQIAYVSDKIQYAPLPDKTGYRALLRENIINDIKQDGEKYTEALELLFTTVSRMEIRKRETEWGVLDTWYLSKLTDLFIKVEVDGEFWSFINKTPELKMITVKKWYNFALSYALNQKVKNKEIEIKYKD